MDRKDVFDTQQLEESFKMSKNYKKYGKYDRVKKLRKTVENKRYNLRSENDETLDLIELVTGNFKKGKINPMKQHTERCVKITNNQREYSFERKIIYPRNKRKIPSSPEESNKKTQKIKIDYLFQNADNNDRKRKDEGNGKTAKRGGRNTTNSSSKKKKAKEVRSLYNEGYYTDNINSDSLHQE